MLVIGETAPVAVLSLTALLVLGAFGAAVWADHLRDERRHAAAMKAASDPRTREDAPLAATACEGVEIREVPYRASLGVPAAGAQDAGHARHA